MQRALAGTWISPPTQRIRLITPSASKAVFHIDRLLERWPRLLVRMEANTNPSGGRLILVGPSSAAPMIDLGLCLTCGVTDRQPHTG